MLLSATTALALRQVDWLAANAQEATLQIAML